MSQARTQDIEQALDDALQRYGDSGGRVLNVLGDVQHGLGYLPDESLQMLAEEEGIPFEQLVKVRSYFNDFTDKPLGEHVISVCDGTACHMRGAQDIVQLLENALGIKVGQTTPDGKYTLRTVHCIGSCGLAPAMVLDGTTHGHVKLSDAVQEVKRLEGR